jgi:MFS family permease
MINPLGTSPAKIGYVISFFTAPAIVFIPLSGRLADKYGRKPVLIVALLLIAAGGSLITLTTDFRIVLALRFVQGIGFAGNVPIITTSIGDMFDNEMEATGQGIRILVNGMSGTIFPLIAGPLFLLAWQYPFFLYFLAMPAAVITYLKFDEFGTGTTAESNGENKTAYYGAIFKLLNHPHMYSLLIARSLPVGIWIIFLTYNSIIVVRIIGGNPFQTGILVGTGYLTFGIASSQVGRLLSIFENKFFVLITANLLLFIGFIGFLLTSRVEIAYFWTLPIGAGFGISLSLYRSYITASAPEDYRAGIVSLGASGARVAATLAPVIMGAVIDILTPGVDETIGIRLAGVAIAVVIGGCSVVCHLIMINSGPNSDH